MARAARDEGRGGHEPANGSARVGLPAFATAGGPLAAYDDPMSKVLGLDAKTSGLGAWFGFTSGGLLLLIALMASASLYAAYRAVHERMNPSVPSEIEIQEEPPPPPPPPPPTAEEAKPEPPAPPPPHVMPKEAPPPPPAPAQAAKVLTAAPDPNEPVDLTGNTIVQGNADSYAGGFTASNGTNANAVHALPSPTGVPGGTGPVQAPPPPGPDRSRLAGPGNTDWSNCPFPPESDTAQVDDARVTIQVDVRADGTPAAVKIVSDPGNGFGREARRCAMNKRFQTALDHEGNPIPGTTRPFAVHFQR